MTDYIVLENIDNGTNTGTTLPDTQINRVISIHGVQLATSFKNAYWIRHYWGQWRGWKQITIES